MEVKVYVVVGGVFHEELAQASASFELTARLTGSLSVNGHRAPPPGELSQAEEGLLELFDPLRQLDFPELVVSTRNDTVSSVSLRDPTGFLDGAHVSYFWFVNDTNYGLSKKPSFRVRFPSPAVSKVMENKKLWN